MVHPCSRFLCRVVCASVSPGTPSATYIDVTVTHRVAVYTSCCDTTACIVYQLPFGASPYNYLVAAELYPLLFRVMYPSIGFRVVSIRVRESYVIIYRDLLMSIISSRYLLKDILFSRMNLP